MALENCSSRSPLFEVACILGVWGEIGRILALEFFTTVFAGRENREAEEVFPFVQKPNGRMGMPKMTLFTGLQQRDCTCHVPGKHQSLVCVICSTSMKRGQTSTIMTRYFLFKSLHLSLMIEKKTSILLLGKLRLSSIWSSLVERIFVIKKD